MPSPPHKVVLIKNLVFYARGLTELTEKMKAQDEDIRIGAKYIFRCNGPRFMTIKYDRHELMEALDWTKVDFNNMLFLKKEVAAAYKYFSRAYKMNIVWFL